MQPRNSRLPTAAELGLIKRLAALAPQSAQSSLLTSGLKVQPLNDDGMGSLRLYPSNAKTPSEVFGAQISDYQYVDSDGVEVIVSLNVDKEGALFELDIWKTDYSPLVQFP